MARIMNGLAAKSASVPGNSGLVVARSPDATHPSEGLPTDASRKSDWLRLVERYPPDCPEAAAFV